MDDENERIEWWTAKRKKYNFGLVVAGICAFLLYAFLGSALIAPNDPLGFEITLFTLFFQGLGYLIIMLLANVFYTLGAEFEAKINPTGNLRKRERIFKLGFWFSVGLPFVVPLGIVIEYMSTYA